MLYVYSFCARSQCDGSMGRSENACESSSSLKILGRKTSRHGLATFISAWLTMRSMFSIGSRIRESGVSARMTRDRYAQEV